VPSERCSIEEQSIEYLDGRVVPSDVLRAHIHNILSTAPQLSISQKALGTLPEEGNVMPKHVAATVSN
jgi:exosome complex RNA-binding protein Csl4